MEATELNPQRCRDLRANERQLNKLLNNKRAAERRVFAERRNDQQNISIKRAKLANLKKARALALGASLIPGTAAVATALRTGGSSLDVSSSVQISVLESQIETLQAKIDVTNEKLRGIREETSALTDELKRNTEQISELRCVI